jgi:hypothetical protein
MLTRFNQGKKLNSPSLISHQNSRLERDPDLYSHRYIRM